MQQNIDTETLLILQLKQGSSNAFDRIYQMYAKRLYAYCLQFTKSSEDAEEIVSDVFVKLWMKRKDIRQEETLQSLLFIMAKHYVISAFRSKINQPVYEEYIHYKEEASANNAADQQLEYHEFAEKFRKAMHRLPDTQQKVIILSKIKELSNKEIAKKLALSEQTVKNALSVGLKRLKTELNKIYLLFVLVFINVIHIFGTM